MFDIRSIEDRDLSEVEALYEKSVRDNKDGFIQKLDMFPNIKDFICSAKQKGGAFFGVFNDDKIIGMGGIIKKGEKEAELCKLHMKEEYKGKGFGKELVFFIEKNAKQAGYKKLSLHVTKTQKPAIGLYQKLNFNKVKEDIYKIEIDGKVYSYDTLYMEKVL